ncbi:MAG: nucleoside permease [Bacteroidales bacterium]|nr:nucleoside permease [Bacteroidales bacterium]
MKLNIRLQLSTLMFLQYFIWGAWYVTLNTYLGETLQFTATQIGLCYGTFAISAMISPFLVGLIADKFFATEKVLGLMHLLGAVLLIVASQATTFQFFYPALLLYTVSYTPTMALSNSLSFHQMVDPGKQFPGVRVLGTIGWIAANNVIGFLGYTNTVEQLYVAAVVSLLLGLYSFTLPHVPPKKEKKVNIKEVLGFDALSLFKSRAFTTLIIASILTCIPLSFYFGFTASFLSDIGMDYIPNKISLGQVSEIFFMLILPVFLARFGVKRVLFLGMAAWLIRYLLFANGDIGGGVWMIYTGIILHGICYDFFFVTGQIYVDKKAPDNLKSSAQGLITFATYGLGMFIGTWFAGRTIDFLTVDGIPEWARIWYVPAAIAVVVLIMFGLMFREKKNAKMKD